MAARRTITAMTDAMITDVTIAVMTTVATIDVMIAMNVRTVTSATIDQAAALTTAAAALRRRTCILASPLDAAQRCDAHPRQDDDLTATTGTTRRHRATVALTVQLGKPSFLMAVVSCMAAPKLMPLSLSLSPARALAFIVSLYFSRR